MRSATASADVSAPAGAVFDFLADLGNHWRLTSRWIEIVVLTPSTGAAQGATVRLRGPLGIRRTVHTRVDDAVPGRLVRGHGSSGHTSADVEWRLEDRGAGTRVAVEVRLTRATALDRTIWAAWGRRWLAGHLRQTVAGLDELALTAEPAGRASA